ncbi:hypothetical protein PTTG_30363 [Puccinia triticina 1-1 BBBD Race 1]|uniref:Cytochrome b5 heme-binding domain-containing protein n=1 Tax=Puccinia triticina (isolate 1-1 / race 1 (BBBD)) TaxID=630390 RepID=A0A180FZ12_PUCT1|nr:hypothetical protein PTTG_30363 [Puccinia triticina 1-1 BBBD Race 1]
MPSGAEITKHNNPRSCWVVIHKQAYDLTDFLPEHPGGQAIILKYAGKDATLAYEPIHPPGTIEEYLDKKHHKGPVPDADLQSLQPEPPNTKPAENGEAQLPSLSSCLSLYDLESIATSRLNPQAWAYYSSGADDEISLRENRAAFQRVWFRPRILRDVRTIDYSCVLLGSRSSMPM